ncbi:MAG: hypothetical protein CMI29_01310 [Opitutae bacterium]|nr:hypothetical protein [Opitutae bacterium]|tara:strand:- start:28202 stop:29410 length:1209 start_codon:yes stop_codon:yes gene_type:complete
MKEDTSEPIDLSSIEDFEIEPSWVKGKQDSSSYKDVPRKHKGHAKQKTSKEKFRGNKKQNNFTERKIVTSYDFQILPRINILEKIKKEMRKTGVSYALSDICETISSKNERFIVKARFKNDDEKSFIKTKIDQKIFSSADEAVDHLLKKRFEECFTKELDIEDKPNKSFGYAYKCSKTNILLPPNNYHRYDEMVKQHIFLHGITENYDMFVRSLVKVEDEDEIKAWLENPLKIYKFKFQNKDNTWYRGIDQLRSKLLFDLPSSFFEKEKIIKINGSDVKNLDRSIYEQFKQYFNFKPNWINSLFTSCLVNLKKSNFFIFKYSEKKHTYASAYKSNKPDEKQLTERVQKILKFLKETKENKKSQIIRSEKLGDLDPKIILVELKWMVKEGYITEFADGSVSIN